MNLPIYRSPGNQVAVIPIDENVMFTHELMGEHKISFSSVLSPVFLNVQLGDYIIFKGVNYKINIPPDVSIEDMDTYSIVFEGPEYRLYDKLFLNAGVSDFPYFGTAREHLLLLMSNMAELEIGWTLGNVDNTDPIFIDYLNFSCRVALTTIAEKFTLEYDVNNQVINMVQKVGRDTNLSFEYGIYKGLYSLNRKSISDKNVKTKIYGFGSTRNLPANYRTGEKRLVFEEKFISNNTEFYGIKEDQYTNEDIFPKFESTVKSAMQIGDNIFSITDASINFDVNLYTLPSVTAKISFLDGELAGEEFEITKFDNPTKTVQFKTKVNEANITLPNGTFQARIGDKYIFLDISMPPEFITAAELKLKQLTTDFAQQVSIPQVELELDFDIMYLRDNNVGLTPGDRIQVKNTRQGIDSIIRITSVSYPVTFPEILSDNTKYSVVLGNYVTYTVQERIIASVIDNRNQVTVIDRKSAELARRGALQLRILEGSIFDTDGLFDSDKMNIGVLTAALGIFGVKSQNFILNGTLITCNFNNDPNSVFINTSELIHLEISNPGNQNIWQMQSMTIIGLIATSPYYVYCKCSKLNQIGTFLVTTAKILPEEVTNYYHFLAGIIYPVTDGYRNSNFTNGITDITGARIRTGIIQGRDGLVVINLDTGTITGTIYFKSNAGSVVNIADLQSQVNNTKTTPYADGKMLYVDPEFSGSYGQNGYNNLNYYNNSGGTAVTLVRGASYSDFINGGLPANPNSTGCYLAVIYNGGASSPGYGGFYFANQSRANAVFIARMVAMIPVGRTINWASNSIGNGGTAEWLTSQLGTGKWEEYLCRVKCGADGTFSGTNYFYITGGPNTGFAWYLSLATVYDMSGVNVNAEIYADNKIQIANAALAISASQDAQAKANAAYSAALVDAGTDASAKSTAAYTAAKADADAKYAALTSSLKAMAYQDVVEAAKLGTSVLIGGYFVTSLIDVAYLKANLITVDNITGLYLSFYQGQIGGILINGSGMYAANGTFYINGEGQIYCTQATISGTINAYSGYIGGFNIESNRLYSGVPNTANQSYVNIAPGSFVYQRGGASNDEGQSIQFLSYNSGADYFSASVNSRRFSDEANTALILSASGSTFRNYALRITSGDIIIRGSLGFSGYELVSSSGTQTRKYVSGIYVGQGNGTGW